MCDRMGVGAVGQLCVCNRTGVGAAGQMCMCVIGQVWMQ